MVRLNLFERCGETINSYLKKEYLKNHFYSNNFFDGVCKRRIEIDNELSKSVSMLIITTVILAFFDIISGKINYSGVSINIIPEFRSIIMIFASSSILRASLVFIDGLIVDNIINTLGLKANIHSFKIYLLNRMALHLWSDLITPNYFGLRSTKKHHTAFKAIGILSLLLMITMFAFPVLVIIHAAYKIIIDPTTTYIGYILSLVSLLLTATSILIPTFVYWQFDFDEADFDEADGSATPEFLARMEADVDPTASEDADNIGEND